MYLLEDPKKEAAAREKEDRYTFNTAQNLTFMAGVRQKSDTFCFKVASIFNAELGMVTYRLALGPRYISY